MSILNLVVDYLSTADRCLDLFEEKIVRRDFVRAWREGTLQQSGELLPGVEYRMHGVGCVVEYPDFEVDFDFVNQHEIGFDAWRLWLFAQQYPDRFPTYQDRPAVEAALAKALADGSIRRSGVGDPAEANGGLFRLVRPT